MTRVLLADDHQIFREALRSLLEKSPDIEVVGEASNSEEVLRIASVLLPDIVCMDIGMPGLNGIEATKQLTLSFPQIQVIALTSHAEPVYVIDMMRAGASGYVTKASGGKELLKAIDAVKHKRQYLSPGIAELVTGAIFQQNERSNTQRLGAREKQVLGLVAKGYQSQQIAIELGIASGTVDVHRRNIMRKLNLRNAVELTRYAISTGLVTD
jgi:two-component system NarL family response regulator